MSSRFLLVKAANPTRETATASAELTVGNERVALEISAPTSPASPEDLLPIFQEFTNTVVDIAVETVEQQGLNVSCCQGCGACCRQLVPVTPAEARELARLIDKLAEPRRSQVLERFASAVQRLDAAGVLDAFRRQENLTFDQVNSLGMAYFDQEVACPFLEEESCSIHPDRPLACRQYLVTSPAEECQRPSPETIRRVPLSAHPSRALRAMEREEFAEEWTPLVLALEWTADHPQPPPTKSGTELVTGFFARLSNRPDLADGLTSAGSS